MPQLLPAPWFSILVTSWLVFLVVVPPKVISHTFPNAPTALVSEDLKLTTWNWQW